MQVTAKLRYLRIAPRKVRLAADMIRGKSVREAESLLVFAVKKATSPLLKLLKSAVASAENNFKLDGSNLYIKKISVNEGPKYKRWMPRARGQAYEIQKKTSHIELVLAEGKVKQVQAKGKMEEEKKVAAAKPATVIERPKLRPESEIIKRPKTAGGVIKRIFKRKAF